MAGSRPHLRVHAIQIEVRDQDESLRFYVDRLGFNLMIDTEWSEGQRWIVVSPPDGSCVLVLTKCGEPPAAGRATGIAFVSDNVPAIYEQWLSRGVRFRHPPIAPPWQGMHTVFEDPDGNAFNLIGFDQFTESIEAERRTETRRQEAARRAAIEMEIAKEVQARLFPQRQPESKTLNYTGICVQARQVGGDYYDFLDLGAGNLGLVAADVAGKGIGAALLMANLQGNLRSQSAAATDNLPALLRSVNRLFYENTPDSSYATLFFGEYCENSRRLRYANAGHLPPLLVRRGRIVERLDPTATVLGIFRDWETEIAEARMEPEDTLVIYTDGITEASNAQGEEFGEAGLSALLCECAGLPPARLAESIIHAVGQFSGGEQQDDLTLVIAQCLG